MGGTTITRYGKTVDEVQEQIREQVLLALEQGLYVDSALVILSGDGIKIIDEGKEAKKADALLFEVRINELLAEKTVEFKEIEKGRTFHVGTAAMYSRAPEPGEWLGTVHVHT